jgi:hypothetical protein
LDVGVWLDWAGSERRQVAGTCECGDEPSGIHKLRGISWLAANRLELLKKDSAPWSIENGVVVYGCRTRSAVLREEQEFEGVLERLLTRKCGPKRKGACGHRKWCDDGSNVCPFPKVLLGLWNQGI